LFMVDVHGRRIRSIDWNSGKVSDHVMQQQSGALLLEEDGSLLACMEDGIYRVADTGETSPLFAPLSLAGPRFNDVKVGPDGRIYGGTINYEGHGAFYSIAADGSIRTLIRDVGNANGLDWDMERRLFYFVDTPTMCVFRYHFDPEQGIITDREVVREFTLREGKPDGMTMDAEGKLWIALWGSGHILRIAPDTGRTLDKIKLPVSNVSCMAFAGDGLETMVITTAAHNTMLRKEPLAGAVFYVEADVPGRSQHRFKAADKKG
jgi:sugar lactone lactonase YvrE